MYASVVTGIVQEQDQSNRDHRACTGLSRAEAASIQASFLGHWASN